MYVFTMGLVFKENEVPNWKEKQRYINDTCYDVVLSRWDHWERLDYCDTLQDCIEYARELYNGNLESIDDIFDRKPEYKQQIIDNLKQLLCERPGYIQAFIMLTSMVNIN